MTGPSVFSLLSVPADTVLPDLEQAFLDRVRNVVQSVAETYNESSVEKEERELTVLFGAYYAHIRSSFPSGAAASSDSPEAMKLRTAACGMIGELEKSIFAFALCYMQINRYMTLVRDTIRREERFLNVGGRKIEWTSDMDFMMRRYKKDRCRIEENNVRLAKAYLVLERGAVHFRAMDDALRQLAGGDREVLVRSLSSALRTANRAKTQKALRAIAGYKRKFALAGKTDASKQAAVKAAEKYIELVFENEEALTDHEGRLFLHPLEVRNALASNDAELARIRKYLSKYQLPYMQGKLDTLGRLKDKLLIIGTLDSLMQLYLRLVGGLGEPLADLGSQRAFESQVENAQYLLRSRFDEVGVIRSRADKTVAEFTRAVAEFETEPSCDPPHENTGPDGS
ncbi:MAG: hypothetical protein EOM26_09965 [Alphaproteobacteria bacterium]|nr:hypothetical protein [Alphaproteobacteria bacterium]